MSRPGAAMHRGWRRTGGKTASGPHGPGAVLYPDADFWLKGTRCNDWSAGNHEASVTVDPDVHPGRLILSQRLDDIRYFASPVDFQGLYSMEVLNDTLWIASSDYPYMYDGAKVLSYDYRTGDFAVAYEPYETGGAVALRPVVVLP